MNIIFLDYDFKSQQQAITSALGETEETQIVSIEDSPSISTDSAVRGILITHLNGGLMAYHSELFQRFPRIHHWIFCIVGMSGDVLKETIRNQFAAIMANQDVFCQLLFDETTGLVELTAVLKKPVKTCKKCAVISKDTALAADTADVIRELLLDWEVTACEKPEAPDYSYCDAVLAVGNDAADLCVPCPDGETVKKWFWFNTPYSKKQRWKKEQLDTLKRSLNALGWNISDYASKTSFSSLHNEQAMLQIQKDDIHPMALVSDTQFVIWDHYGLPVPQTCWSADSILEFLKENTVFSRMVTQINKQRA